jgi:ketol-acid reductoisomerase
MKMFYEKDTDVNLIKDKKIAIFGYGRFKSNEFIRCC